MRVAISTIALVACTSLASAADLGGPYEPYGDSIKDVPAIAAQPSWSGLYFGGHAGWLTGEWDGRTQGGNAQQPTNGGYSDPHKTLDGDGWLGGAQIGYNWQRGDLVLGVEADISWGDLDGHWGGFTDDDGSVSAWDKDYNLSLKYFGTARVRLGYATGRFMPYITGGFAWARTNGDISSAYYRYGTDYEGTSYASTNENHTGWVAGLGAELILFSNWTARAEWLHVDLGKEDYHFKGKTFTGADWDDDKFPADLTFDVFRVGVNYKFGN